MSPMKSIARYASKKSSSQTLGLLIAPSGDIHLHIRASSDSYGLRLSVEGDPDVQISAYATFASASALIILRVYGNPSELLRTGTDSAGY